MMKIFDTSELNLKCERGLDSEVVKMKILSDDYSKVAFLLSDRNIELHAQYGRHYRIRIPRFGRDMVYAPYNAELITVGASNQIWRLDLDQGRYMVPFESQSEEVNAIAYSRQLNLIATGGMNGVTEFWSLDEKERVSSIPLKGHKTFKNYDIGGEITAL